MKIETLKDLDKLISLCRKRGVETVKVDNIEFRLSDQEPVRTEPRRSSTVMQATGIAPGGVTDDTKILTDELTPDQLLFYSAQGHNEIPDFDGMS